MVYRYNHKKPKYIIQRMEQMKGLYENEMKLEFLSKSNNEAFARITVAAFAAQLDPTIEELADIKTAVSEAVTNCIIHGYENTEGMIKIIAKIFANTIEIEISDSGKGIENVEIARKPLYTSKPNLERSGMGFTIMESFMDEVTKFAKNYSENIPKFLEYFRASDIKISNQNISTNEIRLSTIHGSKGLEADTVFLLDYKLNADKAKTRFLFSDDLFFIKPSQKNSFPEADQIAEAEYDAETRELYRLLYVAMTRARNNLYIFTTGSENIFAETTSISDKEIFRETDIVLQGLNNIACNGNKSI